MLWSCGVQSNNYGVIIILNITSTKKFTSLWIIRLLFFCVSLVVPKGSKDLLSKITGVKTVEITAKYPVVGGKILVCYSSNPFGSGNNLSRDITKLKTFLISLHCFSSDLSAVD